MILYQSLLTSPRHTYFKFFLIGNFGKKWMLLKLQSQYTFFVTLYHQHNGVFLFTYKIMTFRNQLIFSKMKYLFQIILSSKYEFTWNSNNILKSFSIYVLNLNDCL